MFLFDFSSVSSSIYSVLTIINIVILGICSLGFVFQVLYFMLSWLKKKTLPKTDKRFRYAILIPAHNEESVIGETVKRILNNQNYPKDMYKIFVCCHNCNDHTMERVKEAGGTPIEFIDPDPNHRLAYVIDYGIKYILKNHRNDFDYIIKIDADNILESNFINRINEGAAKGYRLMRGYIATGNLTQNNWSAVSGLYYMRDSRVSSRVRERLHLSSMMDGGAGMTMCLDYLEKLGGYGTYHVSEDADFTIEAIFNGEKVHFVEDAIVFDDQPATFIDTFRRNKRMGNGLNRLFLKKGWKMLLLGIFTGKISLLDLFFQLLFIPTSFFSLVWILPYFVGLIIFHLVNLFTNGTLMTFMNTWNVVVNQFGGSSLEYSFMIVKDIVVNGILFLFVAAGLYIFETLICAISAKKKLNVNVKKIVPGIILSPLFMLLYNISIFSGILSKPEWKAIARSNNYDSVTEAKN